MSQITSSQAFVYAASGSMNEHVANIYNQQFNSYYNNLGTNLTGWLGETIQTVKNEHDYFMRSRMWELGTKLRGNEGMFVGRYEIGYLGDVIYQQAAEGFMRDIIMANPIMMELYQQGRVSGYDGDINRLNCGIGRDNYYYNKVQNGYLNNDNGVYKHTTFKTTRDNMTSYSVRERHNAHRTWRASNIHIENGYDPSSIEGEKLYTVEQGLERLKKLNEKED